MANQDNHKFEEFRKSGEPTRNLALELVRVTESAAMAAGRYVGRGDKNIADGAAVDAMRLVLNTIQMKGIIVIGEGEKDEAPMLYNGEEVGTGDPPEVDIAVDPIDGTRPCTQGGANSIATVAIAPRGTMFNPGPCVYMEKIAVGPAAANAIDIEAPIEDNLKNVAKAMGKDVKDVTVTLLDRDRHREMIAEIRRCGARIFLIGDGDVAGAIMTCWPESGIDLLMGVGGTPEGILATCALRAMGGNMQGKLYPRNQTERDKAIELGYDLRKVLTINDLVSSEDVFFAMTGITTGPMLKGVQYHPDGTQTDSIVMRGLTGTFRRITATHRLKKLSLISSIQY